MSFKALQHDAQGPYFRKRRARQSQCLDSMPAIPQSLEQCQPHSNTKPDRRRDTTQKKHVSDASQDFLEKRVKHMDISTGQRRDSRLRDLPRHHLQQPLKHSRVRQQRLEREALQATKGPGRKACFLTFDSVDTISDNLACKAAGRREYRYLCAITKMPSDASSYHHSSSREAPRGGSLRRTSDNTKKPSISIHSRMDHFL